MWPVAVLVAAGGILSPGQKMALLLCAAFVCTALAFRIAGVE